MPTEKPRVTVTLEPSTHEVIDRMAALQRRTRGAVIADLLDAVAPAMGRTVSLLEAAAAAPGEVKAGLVSVVEEIHQEFLMASGAGNRQVDGLFSAGSQGGVDPHVVTRGSGRKKRGGQPSGKPSKNSSSTRDAG